MLRTIANIIWFIFGGLILFVLWTLLGLLLCITVIGIPFGRQCFKFARLMIAPFGKKVNLNVMKHPIANIIWVILFGWEMCLGYVFAGVIFCITIIGIPFGKQCFKLAALSLTPFGANL